MTQRNLALAFDNSAPPAGPNYNEIERMEELTARVRHAIESSRRLKFDRMQLDFATAEELLQMMSDGLRPTGDNRDMSPDTPIPPAAASAITTSDYVAVPLPSFYRHLPPASPPPTLRELTAPAMQCSTCGRDLWITSSGYLTCSDFKCGKLLQISRATRLARRKVSEKDMRAAWPDRSIERS